MNPLGFATHPDERSSSRSSDNISSFTLGFFYGCFFRSLSPLGNHLGSPELRFFFPVKLSLNVNYGDQVTFHVAPPSQFCAGKSIFEGVNRTDYYGNGAGLTHHLFSSA